MPRELVECRYIGHGDAARYLAEGWKVETFGCHHDRHAFLASRHVETESKMEHLTPDDIRAAAIEHCLWAHEKGLSPADVIAPLRHGARCLSALARGGKTADWDRAIRMVEKEFLRIHRFPVTALPPRMVAKPKPGKRPCIKCRKPFCSQGPHHRMCGTCRNEETPAAGWEYV